MQVDLPPGSYRLRTLDPGTPVDLEHAGGAFPGLRVTATGVEALPPGQSGEAGTITFVNDAGFELAALIEDRTWTRDALTAPEVISLQVFRDLFAEADAATRRRGGRQPGGAAVLRLQGPARRRTSGRAMPWPSTWCASTSPGRPASCATMTARW